MPENIFVIGAIIRMVEEQYNQCMKYESWAFSISVLLYQSLPFWNSENIPSKKHLLSTYGTFI